MSFYDYSVSELNAFGLSSAIESAFIKAGTEIHFLKISLREGLFPRPAKTENLKVKLEVGTNLRARLSMALNIT